MSRIALAGALVVIVGATLFPVSAGSGGGSATPAYCILCGSRGLADFILNVGLYAPLGVVLAARGRSALGALAVGGALSLGIEASQVFLIVGRDASLGDLLSNTLGAGAGWLVWRGWLRRGNLAPRAAALLPALAALVAVVAVLAGVWLLRPGPPESQYFLQWTAEFGNMEVYEGRVLSTSVGPLPLPGPPGPIARSDSVRALLRNRATVRAVVQIGPPTEGPAPVFSVYDQARHEIMLLGADGADLFYRVRLKAARVKLDQAEIRFPGLLGTAATGDTVELAVRQAGTGYCARVGEESRCVPGFEPGDTWTLLAYRPGWTPALREFLDHLWLALLFAPAGLLGRRWRDRGVAAAVTAVGLVAGPVLLAAPAVSFSGLLAALSGLGGAGVAADLTGGQPGER